MPAACASTATMPKSSSPATQTLEQLSSSFDHGVLAGGAVKRRARARRSGAARRAAAHRRRRPARDRAARRIDDQVDALVGQQPRDDEQALAARRADVDASSVHRRIDDRSIDAVGWPDPLAHRRRCSRRRRRRGARRGRRSGAGRRRTEPAADWRRDRAATRSSCSRLGRASAPACGSTRRARHPRRRAPCAPSRSSWRSRHRRRSLRASGKPPGRAGRGCESRGRPGIDRGSWCGRRGCGTPRRSNPGGRARCRSAPPARASPSRARPSRRRRAG